MKKIIFFTVGAFFLGCAGNQIQKHIQAYDTDEDVSTKTAACRGYLQGDKQQLSKLLPPLDDEEANKVRNDAKTLLPLPNFEYVAHAQRGVIYLPEHWGNKFGEKEVNYSEFIQYHCIAFISTHVQTRLNRYQMYMASGRAEEAGKYMNYAVDNLIFLSAFAKDSRPYFSMWAYSFQNPQYVSSFAWWQASLQVHKQLSTNPDPQVSAAAKMEAAKAAQLLVYLKNAQSQQDRNKQDVDKLLR